MMTATEMRKTLIDKAADDMEFRTRLLSDSRATIEKELGMPLPEGFAVNVHEDGADMAHLVLPPAAKLDMEQLSLAAGGSHERNNSVWG